MVNEGSFTSLLVDQRVLSCSHHKTASTLPDSVHETYKQVLTYLKLMEGRVQ